MLILNIGQLNFIDGYIENGVKICEFIEQIVTDIYQILRPENCIDYRVKDKIYENLYFLMMDLLIL